MIFRWEVCHDQPKGPGSPAYATRTVFDSESDKILVKDGLTIFPASVYGVVLIVGPDRLYSATATLVKEQP